MTEENAIRLCIDHRDPSGFDYLVRRYRREAFYHAQSWLANESDAADACQDAFAAAFAAMPKLRQLDRFYPWFYRILKNRCLNLLARQRVRDRYQREEQEWSKTPSALGAESPNPRRSLETAESKAEVWALLNQLKPKHREILILKYIHEFRYAEIAETLGVPRGTVMSRLYEAREAFRKVHRCRSSSLDHPNHSNPPLSVTHAS